MKKLLELGCGLVGSLRRTARAWGFSHHENPLAKAGCPSSSIGAVAAGGAARKEHIIHLHTSRRATTYLRGESSAARRTSAERKGTEERVSGESSKVLSAPDRRPFGKTNRLSIIDGGD